MDLTEKESLFIHYYLGVSAGNATDAARRAGYKGGYDHLRHMGMKLRTKEHIKAAIAARMDDVAMTSAEILARLTTLARADIGDFLEVDGPTPKVDLKRARRRGKLPVVRKIKQAGDRVEVEIHNPIQALEKLGQYRGMWKDQPPPRQVYDIRIIGGDDERSGDDNPDRRQGDGPAGEVLEEPGQGQVHGHRDRGGEDLGGCH